MWWACSTSEDTRVMVDSLEKLGFSLRLGLEQGPGLGGSPQGNPKRGNDSGDPRKPASLQTRATSMRFLTAMVATGTGTFHLDGNARMRERPID